MRQIASYPYYFFSPTFNITRTSPVARIEQQGEDFAYTLDVPLDDAVHTLNGAFSPTRFKSQTDSLLELLPRKHLKAYYLQDLADIDESVGELVKDKGLSRSFRRTNVLLFDDQDERRAIYFYARNIQGRIRVEAFLISPDGEVFPVENRKMTVLLGNRLYIVKFDKHTKTLKTFNHDMKVFIAEGYLDDVFGTHSLFSPPEPAEEEAAEILEFFENRSANLLFPNISPFVRLKQRNRTVLDLDLDF